MKLVLTLYSTKLRSGNMAFPQTLRIKVQSYCLIKVQSHCYQCERVDKIQQSESFNKP